MRCGTHVAKLNDVWVAAVAEQNFNLLIHILHRLRLFYDLGGRRVKRRGKRFISAVVMVMWSYLDGVLLPGGSMDAALARGVGPVAEDVLFDIKVVQNGGGLDREGGTQLQGGGGRRRRRRRRREEEGGGRRREEGGGERRREEEMLDTLICAPPLRLPPHR